MRPSQAIIDLKALSHNYQLAKKTSHAKAFAVIKANAYGHGAVKCAKALASQADGFAVAFLEEAIELRQAGISSPILLLEGFLEASELALITQYNLWTVIHDYWQIEAIEKTACANTLTVFLKMDSGMHRVGFFPEQYLDAYHRLQKTGKVAHITAMTHFSRADELNCDYTSQQYQIIKQIVQPFGLATCFSNSPTILGWPIIQSDWVRPGLMLYGVSPFEASSEKASPLLPVMTLQSRIISIRELPAGQPVGYGSQFYTSHPTRIGVVAIGYADGYPRLAPNGTPVMIDHMPSQIIGRVSMDMLTVDLTHIPHAGLGSEVELWGKHICATKVANLAKTIAYQLFCNVNRVTKQYIY